MSSKITPLKLHITYPVTMNMPVGGRPHWVELTPLTFLLPSLLEKQVFEKEITIFI